VVAYLESRDLGINRVISLSSFGRDNRLERSRRSEGPNHSRGGGQSTNENSTTALLLILGDVMFPRSKR